MMLPISNRRTLNRTVEPLNRTLNLEPMNLEPRSYLHVLPLSVVVNTRPSLVVTLAASALVALTEASGTCRRERQPRPRQAVRGDHHRPVVSHNPAASGKRALPAVSRAEAPIACGAQVTPPSVECSTALPAMRQRTRGSDERM